MKFQCTKGFATSDNMNVIVMESDVVELISTGEGDITVKGVAGWCNGAQLTFTPREFTTHFRTLGITYTI